LAAEAHELASNRAELSPEQLPPGAIADAFDDARRADDVRDQDRPDRTLSFRIRSVVLVSGPRPRADAIGEIAGRLEVERAAQDRRGASGRQDPAGFSLASEARRRLAGLAVRRVDPSRGGFLLDACRSDCGRADVDCGGHEKFGWSARTFLGTVREDGECGV